ncbi:MAG: ABC transporter ATP-binding protein [Bacteroidales bacterium]|nr:ABC transporter ATP-binding protein [Bacteroidales bacterium]
MSDYSVSARNLSKKFGHGHHAVQAVDGVSFDVKKGELFGLIGPDGAGKTTLFRLLTSLMVPDSGTAVVEGFDTVKDYRQIRRIIGYMPGRFSLYQDLSVEENLKFFATLFGSTVAKSYDAIKPIYRYLEPFKKRMAGRLSGGMKQKLALCCALVHAPKVLFLDEPTTGVDPVSRKEFWEMLGTLQDQGISIVASTPYMNEAVRCHRIAFVQDGKISECDTPENIRRKFPHAILAVRSRDAFSLLQDLRKFPEAHSCYSFGNYQHLYLHSEGGADGSAARLQEYLEGKGHQDIRIEPIEASIEDCFMLRMNKEGGDYGDV